MKKILWTVGTFILMAIMLLISYEFVEKYEGFEQCIRFTAIFLMQYRIVYPLVAPK